MIARSQIHLVAFAAYCALAAIASALCAPAARAQGPSEVVVGGGFLPVGGPVLVPDGVVSAERRADRGLVVRVRGAAGDREVLQLEPGGAHSLEAWLEASPTRLVVGVSERAAPCERCGATPGQTVLAGPLDGPFERLTGSCRRASALRDVDVSEEAVVARAPECGAYAVYDYAGGSPPAVTPLPGDIRLPRIAGRYAAWVTGMLPEIRRAESDVVVWDRVAGAEAYRIPASELPGPVVALDVQDDGTAAFVYLRTTRRSEGTSVTRSHVGWASIAEPRVHELSLPARRYYAIRIASGRIAFVRGDDNIVTRGEIGVVDLAGNGHVLGYPVDDEIYVERFDFDGERIAWVRARCAISVIHVQRISDEPRIERPRSRCPLRLASEPRALRGGRVRVVLDCTGFRPRCGTTALSLRTAPRRGRGVFAGIERRREPRRGLVVELRPDVAALLRRHGRLRLRATAIVVDEARRERRTTVFTLRRAR